MPDTKALTLLTRAMTSLQSILFPVCAFKVLHVAGAFSDSNCFIIPNAALTIPTSGLNRSLAVTKAIIRDYAHVRKHCFLYPDKVALTDTLKNHSSCSNTFP
jgi:hypothetical protein